MNKLNSKSPIQRFKQGKQILKAQEGGDVFIKSPYGDYINKITKQSYTPEQYKKYKLDKLRKAGYIDKNNIWIGSTNSGSTKNFTSVGKQSSNPGRQLKTKEQWESEFNNAKNQLTSQQLMYLDSLGIDTSSAEKMQQGINAYNKNSKLVTDNKWGNNSKAALSTILSSMPSNYRNKDTQWGLDNEKNISEVIQNPIKVIPQSTPFGYRTNNAYEGNDFSNRLKSMGIRSNADLIDFGWRTQGNNYDWKGDNWAKQFRSDINQALGGDWSDANIRKTFNIGGTWGRGFLGGGDISDFQRALQTNAGVWNGRYDQKRDNFIKSQPMQNFINNYFANRTPYFNWRDGLKFSFYAKQGGQLVSKNPINRFKNGSSFGKAFKTARAQGLKEFTWNGKKYTTKTKEEEQNNKTRRNPFLEVEEEFQKKYEYQYNPYNSMTTYTNRNSGNRYLTSGTGRRADIIRTQPYK